MDNMVNNINVLVGKGQKVIKLTELNNIHIQKTLTSSHESPCSSVGITAFNILRKELSLRRACKSKKVKSIYYNVHR